jgi:hypothetical protein
VPICINKECIKYMKNTNIIQNSLSENSVWLCINCKKPVVSMNNFDKSLLKEFNKINKINKI